MEKTIIAALLMLISLTSYAQGLMWTAKAELNMSSMSNVEESKMHPAVLYRFAGGAAGALPVGGDQIRQQPVCDDFPSSRQQHGGLRAELRHSGGLAVGL